MSVLADSKQSTAWAAARLSHAAWLSTGAAWIAAGAWLGWSAERKLAGGGMSGGARQVQYSPDCDWPADEEHDWLLRLHLAGPETKFSAGRDRDGREMKDVIASGVQSPGNRIKIGNSWIRQQRTVGASGITYLRQGGPNQDQGQAGQ